MTESVILSFSELSSEESLVLSKNRAWEGVAGHQPADCGDEVASSDMLTAGCSQGHIVPRVVGEAYTPRGTTSPGIQHLSSLPVYCTSPLSLCTALLLLAVLMCSTVAPRGVNVPSLLYPRC